MELVKENNPILKKIMPDFNFDDPIMDPTELVTELHKVRKLGQRNSCKNTGGTRTFSCLKNHTKDCRKRKT